MLEANRSLGVRAQILLGLTLVTLFAVLSTGYLTLWASGTSLRVQRESTVLALGRAAAAGAAAAIEPHGTMTAPESRVRLHLVSGELTQKGEVGQVVFFGPEGQPVMSDPPRLPADRDSPVLLAVLGGVSPVLQYRSSLDGSGTELLAYAPVSNRNRVVGAVRIGLSAPPPTTVVLRRSGAVLLGLAAANALLVLGLGYMVLTQLVVRPLQTVERATTRVAAGDWEQAVAPSGPREVMALAAAFNQMTASLVSQREQLIRTEKLASVGQLAAGVAHEIGNPLAAILGFVDILRSDDPAAAGALSGADRRDMLDRVKAETQRIHRTIQDLLAYSRPGGEDAQPTDPHKVFLAAQGLLEPQKRFRGIQVVAAGQSWPRVLVSPGRLQQVFVNLLLNAADAMDGAGTVEVACVAEGGTIRVTITDTGPGVPAELRRKIFDPFFTTKPPGHGTGLGLAISRSIVESYGGQLDLGPSPAGARFVVTLPAVDA